MKCLDCGTEVNYEWPKDPKKRAAMQLVYEGVICKPCAGETKLPVATRSSRSLISGAEKT